MYSETLTDKSAKKPYCLPSRSTAPYLAAAFGLVGLPLSVSFFLDTFRTGFFAWRVLASRSTCAWSCESESTSSALRLTVTSSSRLTWEVG